MIELIAAAVSGAVVGGGVMVPWIKTIAVILLMMLCNIAFEMVTGDPKSFQDVIAGVAIYALFRTFEQKPTV